MLSNIRKLFCNLCIYACTCRSFISMILQNLPTTHCLSHIRNPGVIFTLTILLALKKNTKTKKQRRTIGLRVLYLLLLIFMKGRIKISLSEVLLWIIDYDINVCSWPPPPLFASAIFNLRFPFLLFIITTWPWRYCWFAKNSVKWLQLFIE